MSLDLQTVFLNLLELFLLIGAGYGVVRSGALPASASSAFSGLLMNVTLPATILTSLVRPYDPTFIRDGVLTGVDEYALAQEGEAVCTRVLREPCEAFWNLC